MRDSLEIPLRFGWSGISPAILFSGARLVLASPRPSASAPPDVATLARCPLAPGARGGRVTGKISRWAARGAVAAKIYDPPSRTWPSERPAVGPDQLGGRLGGRLTLRSGSNLVFSYDPLGDVWTTCALDLPHGGPRSRPDRGALYLAGARGGWRQRARGNDRPNAGRHSAESAREPTAAARNRREALLVGAVLEPYGLEASTRPRTSDPKASMPTGRSGSRRRGAGCLYVFGGVGKVRRRRISRGRATTGTDSLTRLTRADGRHASPPLIET